MSLNRRHFLGSAGAALACLPALTRAQDRAPQQQPRIVLLGTAGGPPAHPGRSQPATLLQVAGRNYLIDAGENCAQQLLRAGVPAHKVDQCFLSHLHWDHTLGLDYLMATGWMMNRTAPMPVWGPPGTRELVARTAASVGIGEDIFRAQAKDRPPLASLYPARVVDTVTPRVILQDGPVKISAAATSHFAAVHSAPHSYGIDKALAYRFDTPAGSVVITGDTGPSATLEQLAQGCDVLVSEICDLVSIRAGLVEASRPGQNIDLLVEHMRSQHLSPEELGKLATRAGVKKLVLTHFVIGRGFDPQAFAPQIAPFFKGEVIVGRDLLSIPLGAENS
ncbi:MBL fold metallo-hydrolase [Novosphingobium flavum]|uniref:MBL fold metallo-hydrolase n=1 Tax=Novosphingobium flavum TaxID=1778672 RepID=A0A7X1KM69_9SPHN|nr:MBL fold metallo-hydrolase [Novosphingobium flavum]MBC2665985.1 MBL fold metallo-hydrolase [Novosphingobium flavum]